MSVRRRVGSLISSTFGAERLDALRRLEARARHALAVRLEPHRGGKTEAVDAAGVPAPVQPIEPDRSYEDPQLSRHEFLAGLHRVLEPATYLEIGVNDGRSLALSRSKSIGVDPMYGILTEIKCDVQLVRDTSDDFFARPDPLEHFEGQSVDLAFIDGMHWAEFAYRDFSNVERLMSPNGVIVLDDMLPRNADEASRDRATFYWAGDVFKVGEALARLRPDLVVLPVNTSPTGVILVTCLDPSSTVLRDAYEDLLPELQSADPQTVPAQVANRTRAVRAEAILRSKAMAALAALDPTGTDRAEVVRVAAPLRRIRSLGEPGR